MRQVGGQVLLSNKSVESTVKSQTNSPQMKRDSNMSVPSASRFVTRRRRAVTAKVPLATSSLLNSSDDFASGAFGSCRIPQSLRGKRRRKAPPSFLVSSAENSLNAAGTVSFATIPFREISLNESADHSLGPSRRPIFCSTPSAGPFSKRPCLKPPSLIDQCASSPSMSVSCIDAMSAFQKELCSPEQPIPPQCSETHTGLHSSLKGPELSGGLFVEPKRSDSREGFKSSSEDTNIRNAGELLPSLNLLSTDDSEHSSCFVSAAGGLEWLIEALKEKCLTDRCTVQLERLNLLTMTQLCSQTTYSSCLEESSLVHHVSKHPHSVLSLQTSPCHSSDKTTDHLQSVNSFESSKHLASVTESQSTNSSSLVDWKQSAENSSSKEGSTEEPASHPHTDSSMEFIMGTHLLRNSSMQTLLSEEETSAVKDKCRNRKCSVALQRCAPSPTIVRQLQELMQLKKAGLTFDEKTAKTDTNTSENNPEGVTCSESATETMMVSVTQSVNSSSAEAQINDAERDEKAAVPTALLKEGCRTDKVIVRMKRLTSTQLKEILTLKGPTLKSAADVSDSASDDQTKTQQQSESDINHSNEDTSVMKVRKKGSTSSGDMIVSDTEEVFTHRAKKASQAPKEKKRRSTSADRPGTARKACVRGLSVSRWKNKDTSHMSRSRTAQIRSNKTVDCSINELISSQDKRSKDLLGNTNFCTPAKVNQLNLSSLLADLTPNTQTWSRLKAALSVHRKGMVLLTPRSLRLSVSSTPGRPELADVSQDLFATPFRTPLSKRLQSQLQSCSSLNVPEDEDLSDAEKVYAECGQSRPLPWEECILPQYMKKCAKIGEGTFGEVFSTKNAAGDTVALKVIPLEGSEKVNGEDQKTFGEILHEIIISKELSSLKDKQQNQTHGFIGLNGLHCVQGCYPPDFLRAWDTFDQQKGSENDRPDFFEMDQLFIILEFEFGGSDLENSNGTLASLGTAKSILHQVTAALAVAEQELHFEHRDLHWGNVLVKTTKQKTGSFLLNGTVHSLETKGVLVRIIDYSLSRLEIDELTVSCDISNDEELFMGQGDYQFDIYRLMRKENGNDWSTYHPHTNVLWLHYLCSKLLSMKYRGTGGRGAKDIREELNRFYDNVLQYSSATDALQNCPMFQ
ncbi:uncharacterized protein haspin [Halichoeres trimaculatus]|uniref:uncharacterized protein haspin n=1 Tax=Halichoeres trimaculatus TaxID=147232 RepID=UPI003D9F9D94